MLGSSAVRRWAVPLKATERSSLVGRVIDQLRGQIESGEWAVGTKIPAEPVLVQSLGVGRNTVREAIRALVHSGMLEPLQGDGTYVRAGDDLGAAVLAAARRTDADIEALRAALARRDAAWRDSDDEQLISADLHFHRVAVAAAHNGMLADLYDHLTEGLRAVLETIVHSPLGEEVRYQRGSHAALVEAIEAGDQEAAQRCVEDYLSSAAESVRLLSDADQ